MTLRNRRRATTRRLRSGSWRWPRPCTFLAIVPHGRGTLLLPRAGLARRRGRGASKGLSLLLIRIWGLRGRVHSRKPRPVVRTSERRRSVWLLRWLWTLRAVPLRSRWTRSLVRLGMDVGRHRSAWGARTIALTSPQQVETGFDVRVAGVQLGCPLVGVESVVNLVVAGLILKRPTC